MIVYKNKIIMKGILMPFMQKKNLKIYFEIHGKGDPLLFIPGTASDLRQGKNIFSSELVKHFNVLSFDPRGIGQSNSPDPHPTMLTYAQDIHDLLHYIGWQKCFVIGESFGGMIAQELAINFPKKVKKLVLAVTSSGGGGGSSFPYHRYHLNKMSPEEKADFFVHCGDLRMKNHSHTKKEKAAFLAQYKMYLQVFKLAKKNPNAALFSQRQVNARKQHNTYDRLPQLMMPTYICAGKFDNTAPIKNQLALLKQIKQARLSIFTGSHAVLWQDPLAFKSIVEFLKFK